ncbi:hypothetical protein VTN77DRAFT_3459 [Rasamsonia byssochlamydoides]|uniref:uncharacterized protein n=1 Tax=Rasamsonia byssochlamydoides TaxID=89139 RepID=UPI003743DD32
MSNSHDMRELSPQKQNRTQRRSPPVLKLQAPSPSDEMLIPKAGDDSNSNTKINKNNFHTSFLPTLQHLSRPLCPLVSITTGQPHPSFPRTILAYHLLTSEQLDDLARHYHQVWPPVPETFGYPIRVPAWIGTPDEERVDIETKRRRIGRFVGLRGCESPVDASVGTSAFAAASASDDHPCRSGCDDADLADEDAQTLEEQMERRWQEALRRARCEQDPDAVLRRKAGGY